MTQIEKIRAEIKRRIEESRTRQKNLEDIGQENANIVEEHIRATLKALLSFLSTLESEKPMNQEGLEKEINRYLEPIHTADIQFEPFTQMTKCARHFAEWGYLRAAEKYDEIEYNRQRAEESVPNDLEEAAEKEYPCDKSWMTPDMLDLNAHKQVAFRKGAKWQAEHTPSPRRFRPVQQGRCSRQEADDRGGSDRRGYVKSISNDMP